MKTVTKKLFSLMLVLMMLLSVVPFQAFAANDVQVNLNIWVGTTKVNTGTKLLDSAVDLPWDLTADADVATYISNGVNSNPYAITSVKYGSSTLDATAITSEVLTGTVNLDVYVTVNKTFNITFDLNGGTAKIGEDTFKNTEYVIHPAFGEAIGLIPKSAVTAPDAKSKFDHWAKTPGGVDVGSIKCTEDMTLYAVYADRPGTVNVEKVVDTTHKALTSVNCNHEDKVVDVLTGLSITVDDGYKWDGKFYRDSACTATFPDDQKVSDATTVYVKFEPKVFTATFDPVGGSLSKTSKEVKYGDKFYIRTPTKKNMLFAGWKDVNGTVFTPDSEGKTYITYKYNSNATFTAVWKDESRVLLRVYTNGNTKSSDIILDVTNKTDGSTFTLTEAKKLVRAKYVPTSGTKVEVLGLFDEDGWDRYVKHDSTAGALGTITIDGSDPLTEVYVMATNARAASGGSSGLTSSSGTSDLSNPKTGDQSMLEAAAVAMVLTAATMVTLIALRKKKFI